jgi:hypothetical protein
MNRIFDRRSSLVTEIVSGIMVRAELWGWAGFVRRLELLGE